MYLQTFPGIKVLPLFLSRESSLSCYRSDGPIKVGENFFIFILTICRMVDSMIDSRSDDWRKPPWKGHTMHIENQLLSESLADTLRGKSFGRNHIARYLLYRNRYPHYSDTIRNLSVRGNDLSYLPAGREPTITDSGRWSREGRQSIKPGRLVKKLVPRIDDKRIAEFSSLFVAHAFSTCSLSVIEASEIPSIYSKLAGGEGTGTLNSCMQGGCREWFDVFTGPNTSMVIAEDAEGRLVGRALVWETEEGETVVDRIYGVESTIEVIRSYAHGLGWWTKKHQSYDNKQEWEMPDGTCVNREFRVRLAQDSDCFKHMPYMDTFSFAECDCNLLSNSSVRYGVQLDGTWGGNMVHEHGYECVNCGLRVDEDNTYNVEGEMLCASCAGRLAAVPENGYDLMYTRYLSPLHEGGYIDTERGLEDYVFIESLDEYTHMDYAFFCDGCEECFLIDDGFPTPDGMVCDECIGSRQKCSHCGDYHDEDSTMEEIRCGELISDYCPNCVSSHFKRCSVCGNFIVKTSTDTCDDCKERARQRLLVDMCRVAGTGQDDRPIRELIRRTLDRMNIRYTQDDCGNIYATKGTADIFPCYAAHVDTVHANRPSVTIGVDNGNLKAFDDQGEQWGVGGDDRAGVWLAFRMLESIGACKAVFFRMEECGGIGASNANMDWFSDCAFVCEADRSGYGGIATSIMGTDLCCDDFVSELLQHTGRFETRAVDGAFSDVIALVENGIGCPCCNVETGYHESHTRSEYIDLEELDKVSNIMYTIGLTMASQWLAPPQPVAYDYTGTWDYLTVAGRQHKTGAWEYDTDENGDTVAMERHCPVMQCYVDSSECNDCPLTCTHSGIDSYDDRPDQYGRDIMPEKRAYYNGEVVQYDGVPGMLGEGAGA